MPAIMVIVNIIFCAGVVVGIVGHLAYGMATDRTFATHVSKLAIERAGRFGERRRVPRERAGYRGPNRRVLELPA
jgi:hypothetical protein